MQISNQVEIYRRMAIVNSLRYLLVKYPTVKALYSKIISEYYLESEKGFSYHQFIRYLKGQSRIPETNENIITRFLYNEYNMVLDLIDSKIMLNLKTAPIQIDISDLYSSPSNLNLIAYHVINHDLTGSFDAILTHTEAIPMAISFSQLLAVPWYSVSFRRPSVNKDQIIQYPYLLDQQIVETVYFHKLSAIKNKRVLIISDYIRRGGLLDILFNLVDSEGNSTIGFLIAILGIGNEWKKYSMELEGNIRVLKLV